MSDIPTFVLNTKGQELLIETTIDLTGATNLEINIRKPSGTTVNLTDVSNGVTNNGAPTEGKLRYVVENGLWSEIGEYRIIPYVKFSANEIYEGDPPARVTIVARYQN